MPALGIYEAAPDALTQSQLPTLSKAHAQIFILLSFLVASFYLSFGI